MTTTFNFQQSTLVHQLILGSLLFFLNGVGALADRLVHSGLIAQMALGAIYGPPLGDIVLLDWLNAFQELGNLGLVLLVFQGGLSTRLTLLRQNAVLSIAVALAGVLAPMALSLLSFIVIFRCTILQAFTAGAALCSTSLGTTFAILSSLPGETNLRTTRIGTVLLSAAILDDVVGLIMASVVARVGVPIGVSRGAGLVWTIFQPIVASTGMVVITLAIARYLILPLYRRTRYLVGPGPQNAVLLTTFALFLSTMLTISHYTGSSPLFGAFVSGCVLRYLDDNSGGDNDPTYDTFEGVFTKWIEPCNDQILIPLFFFSIGSAIPFRRLWRPSIIWKGLIYSALMWIGKGITGLCVFFWPTRRPSASTSEMSELAKTSRSPTDATGEGISSSLGQRQASNELALPPEPNASPPKSLRRPLYPALLLSFAMVARGEIGLLVAQIGRTALGEDSYLVVMWAIVLCTVIGPVSTGWLVYRKAARCAEGGWK